MGSSLNGILLLLFIVSTATAYYTYRPVISEEAEFALFGNIGSFEDLLSVSLNQSQMKQEKELGNQTMKAIRRSLIQKEIETLNVMDNFERKSQDILPDTKDYNDVTKLLESGGTRRHARVSQDLNTNWFLSLFTYSNYGRHEDPDDYSYLAKWQGRIEEEKLDMLSMCALQYLVHTRFKTKEALSRRSPFKGDKRYMLGYLFNRMRRILYEQRKVIHIAMHKEKFKTTRRLRGMLRLYQQCERFFVDNTYPEMIAVLHLRQDLRLMKMELLEMFRLVRKTDYSALIYVAPFRYLSQSIFDLGNQQVWICTAHVGPVFRSVIRITRNAINGQHVIDMHKKTVLEANENLLRSQH